MWPSIIYIAPHGKCTHSLTIPRQVSIIILLVSEVMSAILSFKPGLREDEVTQVQLLEGNHPSLPSEKAGGRGRRALRAVAAPEAPRLRHLTSVPPRRLRGCRCRRADTTPGPRSRWGCVRSRAREDPGRPGCAAPLPRAGRAEGWGSGAPWTPRSRTEARGPNAGHASRVGGVGRPGRWSPAVTEKVPQPPETGTSPSLWV